MNTQFGPGSAVQVHNSCFFEGASQYSSNVLISNPPYLPAPNDDIMMPQLFGGKDGGDLPEYSPVAGYDKRNGGGSSVGDQSIL